MLELEQFIKILELANSGRVTEYRIFRNMGINYYRMKKLLDYAISNGFLVKRYGKRNVRFYEITEKGHKLLTLWLCDDESITYTL